MIELNDVSAETFLSVRVQGQNDMFWIVANGRQQGRSGATRNTHTLFPVLQGAGIETEPVRERELALVDGDVGCAVSCGPGAGMESASGTGGRPGRDTPRIFFLSVHGGSRPARERWADRSAGGRPVAIKRLGWDATEQRRRRVDALLALHGCPLGGDLFPARLREVARG